MRRNACLDISSTLAVVGALAIGGCDEYHPPDDGQPAAQQPQPGPPGSQGRSSTLGKAKDAGERTRDRMEDYHQRVLEEAEDLSQP